MKSNKLKYCSDNTSALDKIIYNIGNSKGTSNYAILDMRVVFADAVIRVFASATFFIARHR